jgi:glycosyltransferase involved in cell wall biosynthesis
MVSNPLRRQNGRPSPACDLAVLVHEFPKLSETFVLGDLLALEERGVRLHVFSLRRPEVELAHDTVTQLRAPVEYLPEVRGRQQKLLVRAVELAMFARDPVRFSLGLAEVYASPDYSRLRLQQAVLLAQGLLRLGAPPLYVHFAHKPGTVGRFAALMLGLPFAVSAHAVDVWTPSARELRVKLSDAAVVLSCYEEAQQFLTRIVNGATPVELAPHGVEIPSSPQRAEVSPPVLLAVGRLVEKKGFDTLLRAAALLRDRGIEFRVEIGGDGPLWPTLQRLVRELSLEDHARFLGPLTQDELEDHFARAALFVLPCQVGSDANRDGLPNTILEGMARGLPIVSTTLPSVMEAVSDGREGRLVAPQDPLALADALSELLGDQLLRRRLGAAARERVAAQYDRDMLASRVYDALIRAGMLDGGAD